MKLRFLGLRIRSVFSRVMTFPSTRTPLALAGLLTFPSTKNVAGGSAALTRRARECRHWECQHSSTESVRGYLHAMRSFPCGAFPADISLRSPPRGVARREPGKGGSVSLRGLSVMGIKRVDTSQLFAPGREKVGHPAGLPLQRLFGALAAPSS